MEGKGKGLNLNNLKLDPDELIRPVRKEYACEKAYRSRPLWLDIMIGIVAAVILIWLLSFAFISGSAWFLSQAASKAMEEERLKQIHTQQIRIEEQKRQNRLQQLNTPQCRFWTDHYQKNRDQRSFDNMRRYCPQ